MSSELTPSQVVQAQSIAAGPDGGRGPRRPRKRNGARTSRGVAVTPVRAEQAHDSSSPAASQRNQHLKEEGIESKYSQSNAQSNKQQSGTRSTNSNSRPSMPTQLATENEVSKSNERNTTLQQDAQANNKRKKRKNRQKSKAALWKKHLPVDSVDPITLDPLASLKYPPFALVADEPYLPIDWPPNKSEDEQSKEPSNTETEEERQARILHEQWGLVLKAVDKNLVSQPTENTNSSNRERHVNLFDGRALAYYMVSQLQFIDPLNRRDLTRDEIVHVDHYLRQHKFFDLNVTEAYDAKGITVSTAGATAQTARGRATILQEEARHLLNALFGSRHDLPTAPANSFAREYQEHETSQVQRPQPRSSRVTPPNIPDDTGVYGQGTAYVVIDDDLNPGLRAGVSNDLHQAHPASRLRGWADSFSPTRALETMFPPLDTTTITRTEEQTKPPPATNLPKTKTLSKIGSVVQKTDPIEQQRQWEAREAAIRKAALVNRSFSNVNPVGTAGLAVPSVMATSTMSTVIEPTDGQIQRNKAIAEALGVQPTTSRTNLRTGWTRPVDGTDEFGNELAVTIYPESLVLEARNLKPGLLTKIERKWKMFLADDSSNSLPLTPMDRPTRKTIHEYSDFWKLHTESFDPEPQRYIHCVKLANTGAPKPLLSEILYRPQQPTIDRIRQQSSSGQVVGREIPQPPIRTPLLLQPRSEVGKATTTASGMSLNGLPRLSMGDTAIASRFEALSEGRERPKLELAKRTLPLELPAFQPAKDDEKVESLREKARRAMLQKEMMEQQTRKAIEAAFASDDESESSSSRWEEQAPTFAASDEEDW